MPTDPVSTVQTTEFNESSRPMEFLDSDKWPFGVFEEPMESYHNIEWMFQCSCADNPSNVPDDRETASIYVNNVDSCNDNKTESVKHDKHDDENEYHNYCIHTEKFENMCTMIRDMFSDDEYYKFRDNVINPRYTYSDFKTEFDNARYKLMNDTSEIVIDENCQYSLEFYSPADILNIYDIVYNDDKTNFSMVLNCTEEERANYLSKCKLYYVQPTSWHLVAKFINDTKIRVEYVVSHKDNPVMAA